MAGLCPSGGRSGPVRSKLFALAGEARRASGPLTSRVALMPRRLGILFLALLTLAACLVAFPPGVTHAAAAGTDTWTGLGATQNWSDAGNWNAGVPVNGDTVVLPPNGNGSVVHWMAEDINGLTLSDLEIQGYWNFLPRLFPVTLTNRLGLETGVFTPGGPAYNFNGVDIVSTASPLVIDVGSGIATASSNITDASGGVTVTGSKLIVTSSLTASEVTLAGSELDTEAADWLGSSPINMANGASLVIGAQTAVPNPIAFQAGSTSPYNVYSTAPTSFSGPLSLGGSQPVHFHAAAGGMDISNSISGSAPLQIDGPGGATLHGTDTFSGGLTVTSAVQLANAGGLGTGPVLLQGGTLSFPFAGTWSNPLTCDGGRLSAGAVSGIVTWSGPITITGQTAPCTLVASYTTSLQIAGGIAFNDGLWDVEGSGPVTIQGSLPSTTTGTGSAGLVHVNALIAHTGNLVLSNPSGVSAWPSESTEVSGSGALITINTGSNNQFSPAAHLIVDSQGTVSIGTTSQTVASLDVSGGGGSITGTGTLTTAAISDISVSGPDTIGPAPITMTGANPTVTMGNANLTVSSVIGGSTGLSVQRPLADTGSLVLTGNNTYTGMTTDGGGLIVNGSQPQSPVAVTSAGSLGGSGAVGAVTSTSGRVYPTHLATTNVSLDANSYFGTGLAGTTAGNLNTGYGQLIPTGVVNLGGCTLDLHLNYTASRGDSYTLINNQGGASIQGTFKGLPEGSQFIVGGRTFQITYHGGGGNDVVVSVVAQTAAVTIVANSYPSVPGQRTSLYGVVYHTTAGATATPTGTVTVTISGGYGTSAPQPIDAYGAWTFTMPAFLAGTYTVTAAYSGDAVYAPSSSVVWTQTVLAATPLQRFVNQLYNDVLGRAADPAGLAGWVNALNHGLARSAVPLYFSMSVESLTYRVQAAYQYYLGRAGEPAGVAGWVHYLQSGGTDEQLRSGFIASAEFYAKAGGTDSGFVSALYLAILGRAADPGGLSGWVYSLAHGTTRYQVAYLFFRSWEYESGYVNGVYYAYLGRPGDYGGIVGWVNALETGLTDEQFEADVLGSQEYYNIVTS